MPEFRRNFVPGGTYFFTLVAERRAKLFSQSTARVLLGTVMRECLRRYPVHTIAIVLLPDHLHALWSLPPGDDRYSMRWSWIKREFTREWLAIGGVEQPRSEADQREQRRGIWQPRFWEHTIQDESDLHAHFDYIHYNPVKHGHASSPREWPWSSFHRWVSSGHYELDWGRSFVPVDLPGDAGE